jgi:hypothetical protein
MPPFHFDDFGPFVVVHGPNEQGKTLLIDALVRLLFKDDIKRQHLKLFGDATRNIARVDESPEGFVVVRTHASEIKLEAHESINAHLPIALTPEDFRNVFLVRDSDLGVRDEHHYYEEIAEKLTGLRASEIEAVLKVVQRMGRLKSVDPQSPLSNNVDTDPDHVARRMEVARALLQTAQALAVELRARDFDALEVELAELRERRARLEEERERYQALESRRRYEEAKETLSEVRKLGREVGALGALDEKDLGAWRRLDAERAVVLQETARERDGSARIIAELERAKAAQEAARARAAAAEARLRRVREELEAPLGALSRERAQLRGREARVPLYRALALGGLAVAAAVGVPALLRASVAAGLAAAVALAAGAAGAMAWARVARARSGLAARDEELVARAARHGIEAPTPLALAGVVGEMEREVDTLREQVRSAETAAAALERDRARAAERIAERTRRGGEIDAEVAALRARNGTETVAVFEARVTERNRLVARIDAKRAVLARTLGAGDAVDDGLLKRADAEIKRRLAALPAARDLPDDPDGAGRCEEELRALRVREGDILARLKHGSRNLHEIEVRAAQLGVLPERPRCRTVAELEQASALIAAWCARIEHDRAVAGAAVGVFQEIEREEREKVEDLFGPDSSVSALFREITGGRYRAVHYDAEQKRIFAVMPDGQEVPASALSGGAFDQLYLAIRLTVAEKLLPESKGFFVMDDPFLKADPERLERLFAVLRRFVDRGWQIFYFTAKDDVVAAVQGDVEAGSVQLVELGRDLFTRPRPQVVSPAEPEAAQRRMEF